MFSLITFLFVVIAVVAAVYHITLLVVAFGNQYLKSIPELNTALRFAIVIPAHNEAETIRETLHSCQQLDYPSVDIYVIADNCDDDTAAVAEQYGATPLIRNNLDQRGKGYALAFAFEQLLAKPYDSLIVLDADCTLPPDALTAFNHELTQTHYRVLQANYVASNPDESPLSYAIAVGNVIENNLFYMPKDTLGLSILLRGTGMVFTREVLQEFPWNSHSIVEDTAYSLHLQEQGEPIRYLHHVNVYSPFPAEREQLEVQRERWAGNLGFGKKDALRRIWQGVRTGNTLTLDGGLTFLLLSRPLILAETGFAWLLSLLNVWISHSGFAILLFTLASIAAVLQFIYFTSGIFLLGLTVKRKQYLREIPGIVYKLAKIALIGLLGRGTTEWKKTPRS